MYIIKTPVPRGPVSPSCSLIAAAWQLLLGARDRLKTRLDAGGDKPAKRLPPPPRSSTPARPCGKRTLGQPDSGVLQQRGTEANDLGLETSLVRRSGESTIFPPSSHAALATALLSLRRPHASPRPLPPPGALDTCAFLLPRHPLRLPPGNHGCACSTLHSAITPARRRPCVPFCWPWRTALWQAPPSLLRP
jgi:hypothetical protein